LLDTVFLLMEGYKENQRMGVSFEGSLQELWRGREGPIHGGGWRWAVVDEKWFIEGNCFWCQQLWRRLGNREFKRIRLRVGNSRKHNDKGKEIEPIVVTRRIKAVFIRLTRKEGEGMGFMRESLKGVRGQKGKPKGYEQRKKRW